MCAKANGRVLSLAKFEIYVKIMFTTKLKFPYLSDVIHTCV